MFHTPLERLQLIGRQAALLGTAVWAILGLLQHGYSLQPFDWQETLHTGVDYFVVAAYVMGSIVTWLLLRRQGSYGRRLWLDLLFLVFALFLSWTMHAGTVAVFVRRAQGGLVFLGSTRFGRRYVASLVRRPALMVISSFFGTIILGTLLLTFARATRDGQGAPFLTALFTATSATCVTGLIVVDTATYFSVFGQTVILGMIQVGGLGIMTLSAALFVLMGRKLTARQRRLLVSVVDETSLRDIGRVVLDIFQAAMILEGLGALALFARWHGEFPSTAQAAWESVFHAVSAFCNAGFSLFSDNLMHYVADPVTLGVIATLVILGGLGFVVLSDLYSYRPFGRRGARLSAHTRLALLMSGLLVLGGTVAVFYYEFEHSLAQHSVPVKLLSALFQSISARTAGFNTVDIGQIAPITVLVFVLLMFIGGSPGGTAGGIKTTTAALMFLSVRTILRGREDVEVFGRSVSRDAMLRAIAVSLIALVVLALCFGGLLASQSLDPMQLLFESVSAFGTVGYSMGVTSQLTAIGKVLIIVLMFVGRIGPLSLAFAVGEPGERPRYRYPATKVLIG